MVDRDPTRADGHRHARPPSTGTEATGSPAAGSPAAGSPAATDVLLALTTLGELGHEALCRLGLGIAHWALPGAGPGVAGPSGVDPSTADPGTADPGTADPSTADSRSAETARRLRVSSGALARARELLPAVAAIAERQHRRAAELGARALTLTEDAYPQALLDLELPPPALFVRGDPGALAGEAAVAIVGSRASDAYGREVAELYGRTLAAAGAVVVSGFARGIDAAAHRGALAAGGRTVAILGSGLGVDYPRGHRRLADQIAERGALVSEFAIGAVPRAWHFPVRNRLIAALAQATLVVQAAARSGSLITARLALELGREVWAVPGRVFDRRAIGPNALIRDGAAPALSPSELLELLGLPEGGGRPDPGQPAPRSSAGRLLATLEVGAGATADEIAERCGEPLPRVLSGLLELELEGRVRRLPGGAFCRRAPGGAEPGQR